MDAKFQRISRILKKNTANYENRPPGDVGGRFELRNLSDFYEKSNKLFHAETVEHGMRKTC